MRTTPIDRGSYTYTLVIALLVASPQAQAHAIVGTLVPSGCGRDQLSTTTASRSGLRQPLTIGITYFAGRSSTGDDAHLASALTTALAAQLREAAFIDVQARRARAGDHGLGVRLSNGGVFSDVDFALTGTVVRDKSWLTTEVKITRTSDGSVVWASSATRSLRELPLLARQLAQGVAAHIGARIRTDSATASAAAMTESGYELLLRGIDAGASYSSVGLSNAIDFLDSASHLDPRAVEVARERERAIVRLLAWGGIGAAREKDFAERGFFARVADRPSDESERLVEEASRSLDERRFVQACTLLDRAIAADPRSIPAFALRALARARSGKVRDAFADAETVTQLGRPLWGNALRTIVLLKSRDSLSAKHQLKRVLTMAASVRGTLPWWDAKLLATALDDIGRRGDALDVLKRIDVRDPRRQALLRNMQFSGSATAEPPRLLKQARARAS